nr:hypothetical protein [Microvirga makkahensis]
MFIDQHLSETVGMLRPRQLGPFDFAIEASAITEDRALLPATSVGNSATFAILAEKVIVAIDLAQPLELDGLHEIDIPTRRQFREPIPVVAPESRPGMPFIPADPSKTAAIDITRKSDGAGTINPPDAATTALADHLIEFLPSELRSERMGTSTSP